MSKIEVTINKLLILKDREATFQLSRRNGMFNIRFYFLTQTAIGTMSKRVQLLLNVLFQDTIQPIQCFTVPNLINQW